jgi:hypothetical protein
MQLCVWYGFACFGLVSEGNDKGRGVVTGAAIYLDNSDELFKRLGYYGLN